MCLGKLISIYCLQDQEEEEYNLTADRDNESEILTETLRQQRPVTKKITEKYVRKKDLCYFCETDVLNFARHITRNHPCEPEVRQILAYQPQSKKRRELLAQLKKKGNFIKNSEKCEKPVRKAALSDQNFLPCSNCLGFYRSKYMYRHRKKCVNGESSKYTQGEAQNFLIKDIKKRDQRLKDEVFPRMRADKISLEAKSDFLICAFGARYLKIHRERHFVNVTSRKMRELSRILLEFKKIDPSVSNLFEALQPKFYDNLVEATKSVAKFDQNKDVFLSPTYAMNISTSLKQCCDIAIHMIIKTESSVETATYEAGFKTMINLLISNWRFDISHRAGNDLNINRFNKITIVPLASDLKLLKEYLIIKAEESLKILKRNPHNASAYNTLLETIYCRVILLNRRRPGELQRMLLHTYVSSEDKNGTYEEFSEILSGPEKILLKNLKRVVIKGKRGRGVPVMFSADIQIHIKEILKIRSNFLLKENPYLFGKPGYKTPIYGYKVIAKYAMSCGAKNPEALTCTRLRKHLATLTQLFNLNENEIEQLSSFMGHTPGVHKNSYRLPDDVYHTAKISKLLILMEKGEAGNQKGKTLDEITLNLEENLLSDNEFSDDECTETTQKTKDEDIKEYLPKNRKKIETETKAAEVSLGQKKKKRVLIPWTQEQKEVVKFFFASHIKKKQAPKQKECVDLKKLYPDLLNNKNWVKIKVFVQNSYLKKK